MNHYLIISREIQITSLTFTNLFIYLLISFLFYIGRWIVQKSFPNYSKCPITSDYVCYHKR
jgi:hypothetical protein